MPLSQTMPGPDFEGLNAPYVVSREQIAFYRENGYVKLKHVLPAAVIEHYRQVIQARVAELTAHALPMEQRSTYEKAFLQVMNLWTESDGVKEFVFGKRLARIAAELMQVTGVRLYHDQALYKEPGGGITPWHADQYYWPVSSDKTVTAWVPLQATPAAMGPLEFAEKSHRLQSGRDLEISDESEKTLKQLLNESTMSAGAYDLGEVSFHSGWVFHRAGANSTAQPREVMTVIYMDEDIRLVEPKNKNHIADMERWTPGMAAGDLLASPLNPVLYSSRSNPEPISA